MAYCLSWGLIAQPLKLSVFHNNCAKCHYYKLEPLTEKECYDTLFNNLARHGSAFSNSLFS